MSLLSRIHPAGMALAASLAFGLPSAMAQNTGNPKGTLAPPTSDSSKAPANGNKSRSADGGGDTGPLRPDQGPAEARGATSRSPGTGTAGGLPKRNAADGGDPGRAAKPARSNATRYPAGPAKN